MKISFVIAVYQNEGAISKTHAKIQSVFSNELVDHEYEIVFVDDGSKDDSLQEILKLKEQAPEYRTGEITGPGTLLCSECGEQLHFHRPGHIPPCPKCRSNSIRMEGNAFISRNGHSMSGGEIEYDIDTDHLSAGGDGGVHIEVKPDAQKKSRG